MKIRILCVGKIKEKFFTEAVNEYRKRLGRYISLEILETADEMTPESAGEKEKEQILEKEGQRLLRLIHDGDYVITLEIGGKKVDSETLASFIEELSIRGTGTVDFVIGGSLGLGRAVLQRSNLALSFSDLTFPHQLMRVILLEQIYRSFRIIRNEPYHK